MRSYLSLAIMAVLLLGMVLTSCSKNELTNELEETKEALSLKEREYDVLKASVALQNQQIEKLAEQTKAAEERFEKASIIAEANNKKLDKTIASLQAAKGSTCEDAMPLINEIFRAF